MAILSNKEECDWNVSGRDPDLVSLLIHNIVFLNPSHIIKYVRKVGQILKPFDKFNLLTFVSDRTENRFPIFIKDHDTVAYGGYCVNTLLHHIITSLRNDIIC